MTLETKWKQNWKHFSKVFSGRKFTTPNTRGSPCGRTGARMSLVEKRRESSAQGWVGDQQTVVALKWSEAKPGEWRATQARRLTAVDRDLARAFRGRAETVGIRNRPPRSGPPSERQRPGPPRMADCGRVVLVTVVAWRSRASARRGLSERSERGGRPSDAG